MKFVPVRKKSFLGSYKLGVASFSPQLSYEPSLLPYVFWNSGINNGELKSAELENEIATRPSLPFFVVIRIAPLAALLP